MSLPSKALNFQQTSNLKPSKEFPQCAARHNFFLCGTLALRRFQILCVKKGRGYDMSLSTFRRLNHFDYFYTASAPQGKLVFRRSLTRHERILTASNQVKAKGFALSVKVVKDCKITFGKFFRAKSKRKLAKPSPDLKLT